MLEKAGDRNVVFTTMLINTTASGEGSTEVYKPVKDPKKYDRVLEVHCRWRGWCRAGLGRWRRDVDRALVGRDYGYLLLLTGRGILKKSW